MFLRECWRCDKVLLAPASQILLCSKWICISIEAEVGLTQQSFASARQNPGLTVVKTSSIICIPSPHLSPEVHLCNLHQAEVSQGQPCSRTSPTGAAKSPGWSKFADPYSAGNLDLLGHHKGPCWT